MHCVLIGKVWPEPDSTAAGRRTMDLIRALQRDGWRITFASAAQKNPHSADLEAMGVAMAAIRVNDSAFDEWIGTLAPEVVIFDRYMTEEQFGWRVERNCPDALRVLDTSDLHCLREARQQQLAHGGAAELELYNATALREIAAIHRSDLTLMISEDEVAVLRESFAIPENQIFYWPFTCRPPAGSMPEFSERAQFIMIGSFMHPPNVDAAHWCKKTIWPLIRCELGNAEMHLYGSYSEEKGASLHDPANGFHCKGRAGDALLTMQRYRVNLVPLRFGAGLKGKIFDAFETDTPSCVTPVGAEGIAGDAHWEAVVPGDPAAFAAAAVAIYRDPAEWATVREQGRRIAERRFAPDDWQPRLPERLRSAIEARETNRRQNFTGRMLRHHHHRSTEFMSRWIEAKNR